MVDDDDFGPGRSATCVATSRRRRDERDRAQPALSRTELAQALAVLAVLCMGEDDDVLWCH